MEITIYLPVIGLDELIIFLEFIVLPLYILWADKPECSLSESAWAAIIRGDFDNDDDERNE